MFALLTKVTLAMKPVLQSSRNVPPTHTCVLWPPPHPFPVCEWFQRSLHLLPLSGMFQLAPLCAMATRVTSFFLAGREGGRKRRVTVTTTRRGAGCVNSHQVLNEAPSIGGPSTTPWPSIKMDVLLRAEVNGSRVRLYFMLLQNTSAPATT